MNRARFRALCNEFGRATACDIRRFNIRVGKRREQLKTKDCQDGKHRQKIVEEKELPELLSDGWRVMLALPSGKIVVSND